MDNKVNKQTDQQIDQQTDQQKNIHTTGPFFRDKKELEAWLEQSQHETDEFYKYYWTPPKY
ncbi:MAG: hypothetical protein Terrestrivirus3_45 [Terrestrivirus sp.]|jgi:hypothetical protein|uniref:Uncharacterized protein n=1 Tax=Terrestrivirus sp. TaxID=2487775 RepID=A0A3G4ZLR1_9VIRU|nr:MAG: hypothetical protein Terrestrivirus3_45 [Terrestrivirus sp.]